MQSVTGNIVANFFLFPSKGDSLWFLELYVLPLFYIHGSVHRESILIRSKVMQQYAGVYLQQNYST